MSLITRYDPAVLPAPTHELAAQFVSRMKSVVTDWADYFTAIVPDILPGTPAPGDGPREWITLTFRRPSFPRPQNESMLIEFIAIEAAIELANSPASTWDLHRLSELRHTLIYQTLVGWIPTLTRGRVLLPVEQDSRSDIPVYIAERDTFLAVAVFRVTVSP